MPYGSKLQDTQEPYWFFFFFLMNLYKFFSIIYKFIIINANILVYL